MDHSLHIAYFINQYPAISHSFIRREIKALESLGVRVSRFAIRQGPGGGLNEADRMEATETRSILKVGLAEMIGILVRQLLFNSYRFFGTLVFAFGFNLQYEKNIGKTLICFLEACVLCQWLKERDIHHVHAHFGTNSTTVVMYAKELGGIGFSFTVHGPEEFDKPLTIGLPEKIRRASFVVAVSCYGRSQLCRWSDVSDWQKLRVVHCGLDSEFLDFEPQALTNAPTFVCVGRLSEQKGQMLLLQVVDKLVAEGIDLKLVLVGDGPLRGQIEQFVAEHDLGDYVRLTGALNSEQVRDQISAARALALPSFAEGLPVVIMEAFALGRPVISTYVAGIPELVIPGDTGWLVPAGSVDDLAGAMRSVLQTPIPQLAEMGWNGRQRVLERHSIITEAEKLKQLFREVNGMEK